MRKTIALIMIGGSVLLTACGNELPEEELVNNGQAFEMQKIDEDLEASSFPFQNKEKFVTLTELKDGVKELMGDQYWRQKQVSRKICMWISWRKGRCWIPILIQ